MTVPSGLHRPVGLPAPEPTPFTVDNEDYTLPHLDARTWLGTLALEPPGCWWHLIPAALPSRDANHLTGRMLDPTDPLDLDDVEHVAVGVAGAVCGMDFWAATRLAGMLWGNWLVFDGWAATVGFRPLHEPIGRVLAAGYAWRRSLCEKKTELQRVDAELWAPGPAVTTAGNPRDPSPAGWDDDREAAVFQAALTQAGGAGPRATT